uniref:Uncharacterized protein n=1 Tax=Glossina brevipalpis TaxID=37001 RepID=A0A1A9W831_9MUSC
MDDRKKKPDYTIICKNSGYIEFIKHDIFVVVVVVNCNVTKIPTCVKNSTKKNSLNFFVLSVIPREQTGSEFTKNLKFQVLVFPQYTLFCIQVRVLLVLAALVGVLEEAIFTTIIIFSGTRQWHDELKELLLLLFVDFCFEMYGSKISLCII